ncbi:MAG: DUF4132 domain-containing protein [Kiloniellales bacterium]|nr:DUF4132 domain-containing protein [Kiloniellales bacterium]
MTADSASSRRRSGRGSCSPSTLDSVVSDRDRLSRKLESLFLARQPLTYAAWRADYAEDASMAPVTASLIWSFECRGAPCSGMLAGESLEGLQDRKIETPSPKAGVALWHPVMVSAEEVLAWRHRLQALEISQPFRQAHRESYALTEADRRTGSYSKRFAAHILDQEKFAALCRQRGWAYDLQGVIGGFNVPTLVLEAWGLTAEFWIEPLATAGPALPARLPNLTTDQVCFRDLDGERLPLASVPEVVFSEVLRDVDFFVTGASVGNDGTL